MNLEVAPRNIILITVDCLRADHVSSINPNSPVRTPNIDRLANEGYVFTNAHSNGPNTYASFPSIFTSRYFLLSHGFRPDSYTITLAEMLRRTGFRTVAITTNVYLTKLFGWNRGFDEFYEDFLGLRPIRTVKKKPKSLLVRVRSKVSNFLTQRIKNVRLYETMRELRPFIDTLFRHNYNINLASAFTINGFLENLLKTRQSKWSNLFLWIHYMDTHFPYLSDIIEDFFDSIEDYYRLIFYTYHKPSFLMSKADINFVRKAYQAAVKHVDNAIGNLVDILQECGLLDNSIIVLTADHGDGLFEHGFFGHRLNRLYDELIRVPLIIWGAGRGRLTRNVSLIDLAPTLAYILRIKKPRRYLGRCLFDDEERIIYVHDAAVRYGYKVYYKQFCIATIVGRWKLVVDNIQRRISLFDRARDPMEKKDQKDVYKDVFKELYKLFLLHIKRVLRYQIHLGQLEKTLKSAKSI